MLAIGTRVGPRYIIDQLLRVGSRSCLYLATDLARDRFRMVLKEMSECYDDPAQQHLMEQEFMVEAHLMATLHHPLIPKVFDVFSFQARHYMAREYLRGVDLEQHIQDLGPIDEGTVAAWGVQLASVLNYLHSQSPPVVFGDMRPANIMICEQQLKLIDFGFARRVSTEGDRIRLVSPGYSPPEQYCGQTCPRSDLYALGVTLYRAVTGFEPTCSQTPFVLPSARLFDSALSPEMEAILTRATQVDPELRYQDCQELIRDLQSIMRTKGLMMD